jgi:hypothetical protein
VGALFLSDDATKLSQGAGVSPENMLFKKRVKKHFQPRGLRLKTACKE